MATLPRNTNPPGNEADSDVRRRDVLICAALALLTFLVFAPVLGFDFVNIDDGLYVTRNAYVQAGLKPASIAAAFRPDIGHWHPLTWLSYMLDIQLFGVRPQGIHFTNLLLHMANTVLVFALLRRMTGAVWRSALVAAVFAVHPLHVEPVAWVSSRKDVLSTLFLLLTIRAYVGYAEHKTITRLAGTTLLYALGLMAKPMLVTLPALLLVLDYWPLGRWPEKSARAGGLWRLVREKLPLFALALVSCVITMYAASSWGAVGRAELTYPLPVRAATATVAYAMYVVKMAWPAGLAAYYPHPGDSLSAWQVSAAGIAIIAVTLGAIVLRRKAPAVLAGWCWYLIAVLPISGIVQIGMHWIADRYAYVPLLGVAVTVVWGLPALVPALNQNSRAAAAVSIALVAMLAVTARAQVAHWRNSETLWRHAIAVTEDNHLAYGNLGSYLARAGRLEEAVGHLESAIAAEPNFVTARYNLGLALLLSERYEDAADQLAETVRRKPDHTEAYVGLATALAALHREAEAVACLERALQIDPGHQAARRDLEALLGAETHKSP